MGKRGPKPLFSYEDRLEELRKHELFYDNGKVKTESDPVWASICKNLNKGKGDNDKKINVRNIQQYVYQNRSHILRDLQIDPVQDHNEIDSISKSSNDTAPNTEFYYQFRIMFSTKLSLESSACIHSQFSTGHQKLQIFFQIICQRIQR